MWLARSCGVTIAEDTLLVCGGTRVVEQWHNAVTDSGSIILCKSSASLELMLLNVKICYHPHMDINHIQLLQNLSCHSYHCVLFLLPITTTTTICKVCDDFYKLD